MKKLSCFVFIYTLTVMFMPLTRAETRTWTSQNRKTVDAEFVRRESSLVILKKDDGKLIKIPYSRLVTKDQQYITNLTRKKIFSKKATASLSSDLKKMLGKKLYDSKGERVTLDRYAGKTIGIYFLATFCHSYKKFTPTLIEMYNKWKEEGLPFEVVLVSLSDNKKEMLKDMKEVNVPWASIPPATPEADYFYGAVPNSGCAGLVVLNEEGLALTVYGEKYIKEHGTNAYKEWNKLTPQPLSYELRQ